MINCQEKEVTGNPLRRLATMSSMIYSLLRTGKSRLTELADVVHPALDHESRVKKYKRWVTNKHINHAHFFLPMLSKILANLSNHKEVVLAIDGSPVGSGCVCLMISLIWQKRAIPLCWLVRKGKKGHFPVDMHIELAQKLAAMLPPHDHIILLGDGEFSNVELMDFCELQGWKYVFRTAKNRKIYKTPKEVIGKLETSLYPREGKRTAWYPAVYYTDKRKYGLVSIVCHHNPDHEEPWYLVSNLDYPPKIIALYNMRFGIETLFSDLKSRGFNIHKSKLRNPDRIARLLIAVGLAFIFTILAKTKSKQFPKKLMKKFFRQDQPTQFSPFFQGKKMLGYIFDFPDFVPNKFKELLLDLKTVRL